MNEKKKIRRIDIFSLHIVVPIEDIGLQGHLVWPDDVEARDYNHASFSKYSNNQVNHSTYLTLPDRPCP